MSNSLVNDPAVRVSYAFEATQRQYNESPPQNDLIPIVAALNAWPLICGCYMGIEQTMKHLSKVRRGKHLWGHDLEALYNDLDPSEREVIADCYRVYRSLHNFDSEGITLDTAEQFIAHINHKNKDGKDDKDVGYGRWRYMLIEPDKTVPVVHVGLMLEVWRALSSLVEQKRWGHKPSTLADSLWDYLNVFLIRAAEMDQEWQAAARDESSGIKFTDIRDWFHLNGGTLKAGVDLLGRYRRKEEDFLQSAPLLRRVLLRAADHASRDSYTGFGKDDIEMFHYRLEHDDLTWNPEKGVFEGRSQYL